MPVLQFLMFTKITWLYLFTMGDLLIFISSPVSISLCYIWFLSTSILEQILDSNYIKAMPSFPESDHIFTSIAVTEFKWF